MPIIDVTENHKQSITESNINDLTKTFRDRYTKLREILENEQNITGNLYSVSEIINKADTHKETKRTPKLNKYQITNILTKNKQYLKNITSGRYTFKNIYENKVILYDTRQKKRRHNRFIPTRKPTNTNEILYINTKSSQSKNNNTTETCKTNKKRKLHTHM